MSDETGGKQHLAFTDAEINAAASIVNAMIAKGVRFYDDRMIEVYERLLNVTANAKILLQHELYHVPLDGGETEQ